MTNRRRARTFALLGAALLATEGCAFRPLVDHADPKGRSVVLLLDASASMRQNDPDRASVAGAALALGLAGRHDNVGVLAYNARVDVLVPLRPAGDAAVRAEALARLGELGRSESTDFAAVLEATAAMLEEAQAPRGSAAIFLTDGLPTGHISRHREFAESGVSRALVVPEAVGRIAARGWRIFAIALGPEAAQARPYLTQLVAPTGGAVFEARDASALVPVFQEVSVQALGFLSAEQLSGGAVPVPPETRRLAFIERSENAASNLTRDGKALDGARAIRTPAGTLATTLVEDPEPGAYREDTAPGSLALLEPGWYLELEPGSPPASVKHGQRVPVVVAVRSGDDAILARVRDRVRLSLELRAGERVIAQAPLARAAGEGVRFEGAFVVPEKEESLTLTAIATVQEGGHTFTSRRSVSVAVEKGRVETTAAKAPSVDASPSRVALSGFGDDDLRASLTVRGDASQAVRVALEPPPGFSVTPALVELPAGKSATVELRAARSDSDASGSLVLVATPLAPTFGTTPPVARVQIPVSATRVTFSPDKLDFGVCVAGRSANRELVVKNHGDDITASKLAGPDGASLDVKLAVNEGAKSYAVEVVSTPASPPGKYAGEVVLKAGQSTRKIPVTIELFTPPVEAPDKIAFSGSWGWAKQEFTIGGARLDSIEVEGLGLEPSGLARIDADLDIRVAELAPGKFELRVFLAATLPPGRYMGWLKVKSPGPKSIPIILEVTR